MATERLRMLIEQIVRLAVANASNADILRATGLSMGGLYRIFALPEYKQLLAERQAAVLAHMDRQVERKLDASLRVFETAVPAALQGLVEIASQRVDLKARMAACAELLDRDPEGRAARLRDRAETCGLGPGAPALPRALLDSTMADASRLAGLQAKPLEVSSEPEDVTLAQRLAAQQAQAGKTEV